MRALSKRALRNLGTALVLFLSLGLISGCGLNHASPRIAFLGDSLTEGWHFPRVNLGKHGETTAEMLARFPSQIPGKGYKTVVILGGTNDTLQGIDPQITIENLNRMADLATASQVEPILAEIPPIYRTDRDYAVSVARLNAQITQLAAAKQLKLIDYFDPLKSRPHAYTSDGIHLKRIAYAKMEYALAKVENPF